MRGVGACGTCERMISQETKRAPRRASVASRLAAWVLLVSASALPAGLAAGLDADVQQLVVSIAPGWDSTTGRAQLFERSGRGEWKAASDSWPVLYGPTGLAWGRGVLGTGEPGLRKVERDKRAPAGVFRIGKIYTYDSALPPGADFPFLTLTDADAWVDDPASSDYNRHVRIPDPENPPPWFAKQKMRHGDFAYRWLVEIRHNSDPPVAGAGSAIFFHIRRGPARPSAGCTVMAEENLVRMIRWFRAAKSPHYVLLPRAEYARKWEAWGLPIPESAAALLGAE